MDGGELGELEYENFNAASARVTIRGFNLHPGSEMCIRDRFWNTVFTSRW